MGGHWSSVSACSYQPLVCPANPSDDPAIPSRMHTREVSAFLVYQFYLSSLACRINKQQLHYG